MVRSSNLFTRIPCLPLFVALAPLEGIISTVRMTRHEAEEGTPEDDNADIPTEPPTTYSVHPLDWETVQRFLSETSSKSKSSSATLTTTGEPSSDSTCDGAISPVWVGKGRSVAATEMFGKVVVIERVGKRNIRTVVRG